MCEQDARLMARSVIEGALREWRGNPFRHTEAAEMAARVRMLEFCMAFQKKLPRELHDLVYEYLNPPSRLNFSLPQAGTGD